MTKFLFPRFSFLHPASDPKFSFGSLALAFLTDEAILATLYTSMGCYVEIYVRYFIKKK
jgi:hypothetical protein